MGRTLAAIVLASCARSGAPGPLPAEPQEQAHNVRSGTSNYAVLYEFGAPPDGNTPTGDLVLAADGRLYGTTYGGGSASGNCANGCGTIYSLDPNSSYQYSPVYSFQGAPDGANPQSGLNPNGVQGELFGTTFFGGSGSGPNCYTGRHCGTVFEIGAPPTGNPPTIVYSFKGGNGGANPRGARQLVGKTYYGATEYGGKGNFGTIYSITTDGTESLVYAFKGGSPGHGLAPDGAYPSGDLAANANCHSSCTFWGTTLKGGKYNDGTIFQLTQSGNAYKESVLYSFSSAKGDEPVGVENRNGTLYGAASRDGASNRGSIFSYSIAANKFTVLHAFTGSVKGHDGALPYARPIYYPGSSYGSLFGTTQGGGKFGQGAVYRITLNKSDSECVIHSFPDPRFPNDGVRPSATLRQFSALGHNFYGTTLQGPPVKGSPYSKGYGTIFRIAPNSPCAK